MVPAPFGVHPAIGGGDFGEAALGDMACDGLEANDVIKPDAGAEPGDEIIQRLALHQPAFADLLGGQGLHIKGLEPDPLDAETGLDLADGALEQPQDPGRVAHRAGEAEGDILSGLVDALHRQHDGPRACFPVLQPQAERVEKAGKRGHDIIHKANRLGETHPHTVMRRLGERGDGLAACPERLFQPLDQGHVEAAGQGGAGQGRHVGNGVEAKAFQRSRGFFLDPQCGD